MLNQLVVPAADPIPDSDVAAVRAWVADLGAPREVLSMLGIDVTPVPVVVKRRKLTIAQVREIRRLAFTGLPTVRIGERFDVSQNTVTDILRGRTWAGIR